MLLNLYSIYTHYYKIKIIYQRLQLYTYKFKENEKLKKNYLEERSGNTKIKRSILSSKCIIV